MRRDYVHTRVPPLRGLKTLLPSAGETSMESQSSRGFWQRDAKRRRLRNAQDEPTSELAYFLILEILWGSMSPATAKKIAKLTRNDIARAQQEGPEFSFSELETLADLPNSNTYSSLLGKLAVPSLPIHEFKLPLQLNSVIGFFSQCAMWPHEVLSALYHEYKSEWKTRILPDPSKLRKFWRSIQDNPLLDGHPVLGVKKWMSRCIPISIHGDGVPCIGVGRSWGKPLG